jgi:hypothetical protein
MNGCRNARLSIKSSWESMHDPVKKTALETPFL